MADHQSGHLYQIRVTGDLLQQGTMTQATHSVLALDVMGDAVEPGQPRRIYFEDNGHSVTPWENMLSEDVPWYNGGRIRAEDLQKRIDAIDEIILGSSIAQLAEGVNSYFTRTRVDPRDEGIVYYGEHKYTTAGNMSSAHVQLVPEEKAKDLFPYLIALFDVTQKIKDPLQGIKQEVDTIKSN
ncbi:MAG: hypothetical protein IH934_06315 [Nanoarchaeota archaeon]|nr:hypothetical protein [Nanoarchaeota archaeon]